MVVLGARVWDGGWWPEVVRSGGSSLELATVLIENRPGCGQCGGERKKKTSFLLG